MPNTSDFSAQKKQKSFDSCFSYSDNHDDNEIWAARTASATECTGLIPALPDSEEERKAYEELYPPNIPDSSIPKQPRSIPD